MTNRSALYSRLQSENGISQSSSSCERVEHNVDVRSLQNRCCVCISVALLICLVLWLFDPPAGIEPPPGPDNTNTQLKYLLVVHRHGARSSISQYDFEKNISWTVSNGTLLDKGFEQGFLLGRELRNLYWPSLSTAFNSYVDCFSTDFDRTVDTANSVLLGLFTANDTQYGNGNCTCRPADFSRSSPHCVAECIGVNFTKIPEVLVLTEDTNEDAIFMQVDECTEFQTYTNKLLKSPEYKNASGSELDSAFDYAKKLVGKNKVCYPEQQCHNITLRDIAHMWDTAQCLKSQGGKDNGPYEDPEEAARQLLPASQYYWHLQYSPESGPFAGGIALDRVADDLNDRIKIDTPVRIPRDKISPPTTNTESRVTIYSAHDSTLAGLLAAMNVTDWEVPEFTSRITFELFGPENNAVKGSQENHYVRVKYSSNSEKELVIGNCEHAFCKMSNFMKSIKDRRKSKTDCTRGR